jgi:tRNA(Ile)-lysidine synthase
VPHQKESHKLAFVKIALDTSLIPDDSKILVAVSGGADSVALLRILHVRNFNLIVAHVNHGLRDNDSDDDENFVRKLSTQLQIPFITRCVEISQRNGRFSENEARIARYAALLEMARATSSTHIATGHTADDNLETVILQLLRAATVDGLGGIKPQTFLAEKILIRPLWQVTRDDLRDYLESVSQSWREDSSNASTHYARNAMRLQAIPLLAQIGGRSTENLAHQWTRASQLWRDDVEYLEHQAQELLQNLTVARHENFLAIDAEGFRALPVALQRRVLRRAASEAFGSFYAPNAEHIEAARRQVQSDGRRAVWQWPNGVRVEWTGKMAGNRLRVWRELG